MSDDRRVHGMSALGNEIVRYERAGKWFLEHTPQDRVALTFSEAVECALRPNASVRFGVPGGERFDAAVRKGLAR